MIKASSVISESFLKSEELEDIKPIPDMFHCAYACNCKIFGELIPLVQ